MEQQPRLPLWFLAANWALVVASFAIGCWIGGRSKGDLPEPQSTALGLIYEQILQSHVEAQDGHVLLDRAIAAMVKGLDPYSRYVSPGEVAEYDERSTGQYEGAGLLIVQHGEDLVVHYPFPGGPAERAGVRPGDCVIGVDGENLLAVDVAARHETAARLVRGPAGTTVRLRLRRDGTDVELAMERSGVQRSAVKWLHVADEAAGLGYVLLTDFHPGVAQQIADGIESLRKKVDLRGLVLDLRFDGGGSLDECVELARTFLRSGTIVTQRRRGSPVETFAAKPELCAFPDLPLVLLVNSYSASASEVLTAALQDHGRAAVVGTPTYGKGYVNTVYTWGDRPFRLKLTTAHFYTPNGRNLERPHHSSGQQAESPESPDAGGITPDVRVDVDEAASRLIVATLQTHEPPAEHLEALTAVANKYGFAVPAPPRAETDPQLAQALATLRERIAAAPPNGK